MPRIEDAVSGVLDALHGQGLKESSIQQISWSVYRSIINWHYEHDTEFCSDELLESLCERQRVRYEGGEISRKFYRSFVTASFRFRSYVATGEVDFSIVKDARRYRPNESYQKLTEAILQSTDLTDGHKKRLSIPINVIKLRGYTEKYHLKLFALYTHIGNSQNFSSMNFSLKSLT